MVIMKKKEKLKKKKEESLKSQAVSRQSDSEDTVL